MAGTWDGTRYTGDASPENVVGTAADEVIWTYLGNDVIRANGGHDTVDSGMESDKVFGGAGNDVLSGLGCDDLIDVGTGSFTANGGAGFDTLVIDLGQDFARQKLFLTSNFTFSTANTTGTAQGFEVFSVRTGDLDDRLTGGDGNDSLNSGNGDDKLFGGLGDDLLTLGLGAGLWRPWHRHDHLFH